ncbi:protein PPLZ12-like [Gossypium australe]|uniref:Protein PPLZ12-like n=1 Tax=Gossypium australe TaxID=47621 RepID=A0A5B6US41_9ROSI|nr:protein PPLZ12-like [Gossypium australe]
MHCVYIAIAFDGPSAQSLQAVVTQLLLPLAVGCSCRGKERFSLSFNEFNQARVAPLSLELSLSLEIDVDQTRSKY